MSIPILLIIDELDELEQSGITVCFIIIRTDVYSLFSQLTFNKMAFLIISMLQKQNIKKINIK